jgi:hypothetical protein
MLDPTLSYDPTSRTLTVTGAELVEPATSAAVLVSYGLQPAQRLLGTPGDAFVAVPVGKDGVYTLTLQHLSDGTVSDQSAPLRYAATATLEAQRSQDYVRFTARSPQAFLHVPLRIDSWLGEVTACLAENNPDEAHRILTTSRQGR